jgi:transcriptional regulator with XRE-family HTH domain
LKTKHPNTKNTAIAEALGISDTTLRKYLRNEALTLERRVIETACDYLGVGLEELFELVPCDFFPHDDHPLRLLRGRRSGLDDFGTINNLGRFFAQNGVSIEEEILDSSAEITERLWSENCLIVGSPRSNAAGEGALCELFQADPLDMSKENRRKLPLVMQVPTDWHPPTALIQALTKQGPGLTQCQLLAAESALELEKKTARAFADYYPQETFVATAVDSGRDFGVIFVADHETAQSDVAQSRLRTYWISGFSSVGTQAATLVLESGFRSFSIESGEFILAIVQANYSKRANSPERKLLQEPKIVHTIRGRLPAATTSVASVRKELTETGPSDRSVFRGAPNARRVNDEPMHSARRQKFRIVVKKTWRSDINKEMPVLMEFYDHELRDLPEQAFTSMLARLEEEYGTIPQDRRPQHLDRYLQSVIRTRDGDLGGLFSGQ